MSEAERVRGLVAPFAEERDMYVKQIKAMLDEEKRRASNHVSGQWIYGKHIAAARAYEKVLSIVEVLEHRTRAMEQMYRDHLNTCVGGIFVREAALAAEPTREQERVPSPGQLLIGTNGRGEVVIEHPDIDADKDGVGHIIFSTKEARALARTLLKKTDEAEQELRALAAKEGK